MFGNGKATTEQGEAQSTSSMWGSMLGLGPMLKMLADPDLHRHAHQMIGALIDSAKRYERVEAKLDILLTGAGHDVGKINKRLAASPGVFDAGGSAGNRANPVTGALTHDGGARAPTSLDAADGSARKPS
jgi:hypothetical protein